MTKISRILIAVLLLTQHSFAQSIGQTQMGQASALHSVSEFFVGSDFGKPLMTIHLLNGVKAPGVYHVPIETDLAQLISYAGGATEQADLESISIRRKVPQVRLLSVDLESELKIAKTITPVVDHDIIHIEQKATVERTMTWVSIIASLASIALSVTLIQDIRSR